MRTKRFAILAVTVVCVFTFFSSAAHAEFFSVSAGIPVAHNLSNSDLDTDGVSGYLVHLKLPIMLGLGMESYETKIDHSSTAVADMKLNTTMYDVFWLTPIPVINLTIGAGIGTVKASCEVTGTTPGKCSDYYDTGTVTQLWGQLGINVLPFIDLHVSYHQISGDLKGKNGTDDSSVDGNMYAVGASIIF